MTVVQCLGNFAFGLLGGFSSLGLFCLYKHLLTKSKVKRLRTADPRASGIVIHNGVVRISGQIGEISTITETDVTQQTEETLKKIETMLAEAGTNKSRILEARIWLKDIGRDFAAMNAVWNSWVDTNNKVRHCTS